MNKCEKCGFLHYRTDPCRKPKKSTAARKDVHEGDQLDARPGARSQYPTRGSNPTQAGSAGTQALPVDTNSLRNQNASSGNADGSKPLTQTKPAKFDKTAYQRSYVARWRRGEVGNKHRKSE